MIYLKWTQSELATLDMDALYTEVDDDGWVHAVRDRWAVVLAQR